MDEYRPYPTQEPEEPAEHDESEERPGEETATTQAAAPYADTEQPEESEKAQEQEEEEEEEEEQEEQPAGRRGERQRPGREERQAPDLEHPGGHMHGVIARLNRPRRFGFLRADDGAEVFFHASALEAGPNAFDALRTGQEMEFDCHQDEQGRGLAATAVTIIGEPPERPPRPPRAERPERQERSGRRGAGWRVHVLTERGDQTVAQQLERLLNDRNVKPGNFTFDLTETDEGVECWVTVFSGNA